VLRSSFGVPERENHKQPARRFFYTDAKAILAALDQASKNAQAAALGHAGTLAIGSRCATHSPLYRICLEGSTTISGKSCENCAEVVSKRILQNR